MQTRDTMVKLRTALKNKVNNICSVHGVNLNKGSLGSEKRLKAVPEMQFETSPFRTSGGSHGMNPNTAASTPLSKTSLRPRRLPDCRGPGKPKPEAMNLGVDKTS